MLVVDDDADIRESLTDLLLQEGYRVHTAGDGREALGLLVTGPRPAVVLLDLMMPRMNGWQLRDELASRPDLARIPLIILTAVPLAIESSRVMTKPVPLPELLEAIAACCPAAGVG